ncbi:MAG: Tyrosine-protein kinase MasK [Myxococcota bacterium]|nr:Tyrosine-protein kinase MasK [Myxococcota bacterium]
MSRQNPPPEPDDLILGRYSLGRRAGRGGMAEVFEARDLRTGRRVAVKMLLPWVSSDLEVRRMFRDEMAILHEIRHPNVTRALDAGEHQGQLALVMEWLDGPVLHHLIQDTAARGVAVPPLVWLWMACELLSALDAVHGHAPRGAPAGLVHRDVTPENLMLHGAARLVLTDFGVAWMRERLARTQTGVIKGKRGYLTPEQVLGLGVSARTDLFQAGLTLWELATGEPLAAAESEAAERDLLLDWRTPPLREFRPDLALHQQWLERMLEARPENRFPSARDALKILPVPDAIQRIEIRRWLLDQDLLMDARRPRRITRAG